MSVNFQFPALALIFLILCSTVCNAAEVQLDEAQVEKSEALSEEIASNKKVENESEIESTPALYIFSDVEGRFEEFQGALIAHGLIDAEMNWTGADSKLVAFGNFSSGLESLTVGVSLFNKLREAANSEGGTVQLVLGEKDVELILKEYAADHSNSLQDLESLKWMAKQDFIIQVYGQVITNGGISSRMEKRTVEEANLKLKKSLERYLNRWQALVDSGKVESSLEPSKRVEFVASLQQTNLVKNFLKSKFSFVKSNYWPLLYSGNSFCHPLFEQEIFDTVMDKWNAKRVWSANKKFVGADIESRFQQRILFLDRTVKNSSLENSSAENSSAENSSAEKSKNLWGAKIEKDGSYQFLDGQSESSVKPVKMASRHYPLPHGMSVDEIKDFLLTAKVIEKDETKEGKTKPLKLKLEKDGKTMKAIFKYVNNSGRKRTKGVPKTGDKFDYEMAAYHLNGMLDINLVPIAVERVVANKRGVVQLWIDDLVSAIPLNTGELTYDGMCDPSAQENMINSFDYLIMNTDRNQTNITFTKHDWQIWFIDHTRSFGLGTRVPPFLKGIKITPTKAFKEKLQELDRPSLNTLDRWLSSAQIEAVWERRNRLLESDSILE